MSEPRRVDADESLVEITLVECEQVDGGNLAGPNARYVDMFGPDWDVACGLILTDGPF